MTERREIDPDEIKIRGTDPEQIKTTGIEIDNGEFKVRVDKNAFDSVCERRGVHPGLRKQLWQRIEDFNTRMIAEKEGTGTALGSGEPFRAIQSELWTLAQERADVPDFSLDEVKEFVKNLN